MNCTMSSVDLEVSRGGAIFPTSRGLNDCGSIGTEDMFSPGRTTDTGNPRRTHAVTKHYKHNSIKHTYCLQVEYQQHLYK